MPESDDRKSKEDSLRELGALNPRPGSVADELFAREAFFDPRDLVQVKYEMLRRVQLDRKPVGESASAFGFSRPSFYRIQAAFEAEGLSGLLPRQRGPQQPHKMTAEILDFVCQARSSQADLRPEDLVLLVQERFGVLLHPRTIERGLSPSQKKTARARR